MPNNDELIMDPEAVASYLQVPLATIYAWRYKGEGPPAMKVGRHLRYRRSEVDAWLDLQRVDRKRLGK
ncbi:MAG: helix-turn-helix transcriptional regulator [Acidimicrobiales bacterium]